MVSICEMCSLNINGWELMISVGFLGATGYNFLIFSMLLID
jgi:hypothetical protein